MSPLAIQQEALLEALFDQSPTDDSKKIANYLAGTWTKGLKAYQINAKMLALRSAATTFPVLAHMLGNARFVALASDFWHAHPPVRGDLAQWGEELGAFISTTPCAVDEPRLMDVARVEWAQHRCADSADQAAHPQTLALLTEVDPARLQLIVSPGCAIVRNAWPVVSIVSAPWPAPETNVSDPVEFGDTPQDRVAEIAVVWRYHFQPRLRLTLAGEAAFLEAVLTGSSLADALANAPTLDFTAWVPVAVQSRLLLGVVVK